MTTLIATLICLSPLLLFAGGYYIGRYGSPIIIQRQHRRDRRQAPTTRDDHDDQDEMYS